MKKLFLLFVIPLLFGCSRKSTKTVQQPTIEKEVLTIESEQTTTDETNQTEAPVEAPPYLVAVLEKTDCYGICPSFEVRLFSNGRLTYKGKKDVAMLGIYEAWTDLDLLQRVKDQAYKLKYFELADVYPPQGKTIEELPLTITYLNFDEKEKTIINNYGSPKALRDFETFLEELLMQVDWKKVNSLN